MKKTKKETDVLYIVIPAYNEKDNIVQLIDEWYPIVERHSGRGRSRLVIINDGSTDGTLYLAEKASIDKPLLEVLTKENGGHGRAVLEGYRYALESGADYIFQTDSDRQTSPSEFEGFWRQRTRFDAVIGNRYMREDGISRCLVSRMESLLVAAVLRVWVKDANTPFRLMRSDVLGESMRYIEEDESIPNIMLSAVFKRKKYRVLYKDIKFRNRQAGKNTIDLKKISKIGAAAVKRFIRLDERLRKDNL